VKQTPRSQAESVCVEVQALTGVPMPILYHIYTLPRIFSARLERLLLSVDELHFGKIMGSRSSRTWGVAVNALEAANRTRAGMVEGGFILKSQCISRVIKFDSKSNKNFDT
jgi:hypothetical protein